MTVAADFTLRQGTLDLDLAVQAESNEVVALLGPNGAGKTTVLRTLAGLQSIDTGRVTVGDEVVDDPSAGVFVPAERRPVGIVFQDYLLFPHLTLVENVAFGLRSRGAPARQARATAREWLERVGVGAVASAKPRAVSGGQAQRAALARALATRPALLLLDEPLSALDAGSRGGVRRDLRQYLRDFAGATIVVTHDALDALALADRVMILEDGSVTQSGTLADVTTRPRSAYVAELVGVNLLRGTADGTTVVLTEGQRPVVVADPAHGPVLLIVRPHAIALHHEEPESSARNRWHAPITGFDLLGDRVRVRLGGDTPLVAEVTPAAVADMHLAEGDWVWASVKATEITVFPV